ncbi:ELWxxDGT repeat protein [Herpetosiphon giganteus]|uniref:ELWxxDGT repeat protein n=1 Tax=Herpetosiphon giganteus TaxID=2029754 RepID=UPI001EF79F6A|nr:ELWxxDGT repeat protein [Herpetosiphon giganteus]MBM7842281.1 ELWxxDGT repeat protein [Herpetosiphon giganteus]
MMKRWMLLGLIVASLGLPQASHAAELQCFEQTGFCTDGRFLEYWRQNGGLAVFGYPLTTIDLVYNNDSRQHFLTQQFERARFEFHPELAAPYDMLLGRLGDDLLRYRNLDSALLPREAGPQQGCLWFETTGHNVCNQANGLGFMAYWQNHGLNDPQLDNFGRSLQLFGYPLTEVQTETNANGDSVLTQHFERARFEWHPNQPDQFKVLLGLVGKESQQLVYGEGSNPSHLTMIDSHVFFTADNGVHGQELWVSDGTDSGTRMVKDIVAGAEATWPTQLEPANHGVFFVVNQQAADQLWFSDGTELGTRIVKEFEANAKLTNFKSLGNGVIFWADDGVHGIEPWYSNGTEAGTYMLRDLNPGSEASAISDGYISYWIDYAPIDKGMAFIAYDSQNGAQIWWTNGERNGTRLVSRLPKSFGRFELERLDDLHLIATSGHLDYELGVWNINLANGDPQFLASYPMIATTRNPNPVSQLTAVGGMVYYLSKTQNGELSLWRTNGDPAQTSQINLQGYQIERLVASSEQVYFALSTAEFGKVGWWYFNAKNELTQLTPLALQLHPTGNRVFGWESLPAGLRLYSNDGRNQPLKYRGSVMGKGTTFPYSTNEQFFDLSDFQHGKELWYSDGSTLRMVKDIRP